MTKIRLALGLALLAAASLFGGPSQAATNVLCAPNTVDQANARRVVNPNTNTAYVLNGQGCAVFAQADVGYFVAALGFSAGPPFGPNVLYSTGVLTGTASVQIGTLPANTYIQHIIVNNTTANAVTGGINIGSTASGADVISAIACGANCLVYPLDSALLKRIFSTTAQQPIFATAVTSWNSANVTFTVVYGYF